MTGLPVILDAARRRRSRSGESFHRDGAVEHAGEFAAPADVGQGRLDETVVR